MGPCKECGCLPCECATRKAVNDYNAAAQLVARDSQQREADNLHRRRYAEAALTGFITRPEATAAWRIQMDGGSDSQKFAVIAFDYADAMLAEQKRRESSSPGGPE